MVHARHIWPWVGMVTLAITFINPVYLTHMLLLLTIGSTENKWVYFFTYSVYDTNYSSVFSYQWKFDSPVYNKCLYPVIYVILITIEPTVFKEP